MGNKIYGFNPSKKTESGLDQLELYPYQKKILKDFEDNKNVIVASARQMGVTTLMLNYIFNKALNIDNTCVLLIANFGTLQHSKSMLKKLSKIHNAFGVKISDDKLDVTFSNGSKIKTSEEAEQFHLLNGYHPDIVVFDQAAYFENFENLIEEITKMIKPGSQSIVISTPKDKSYFNKLFYNSHFHQIQINKFLDPKVSESFYLRHGVLKNSEYDKMTEYGIDMHTEWWGEVDLPATLEKNAGKNISVRIDEETIKNIKKISRGKNLSDYLRELIKEDLKKVGNSIQVNLKVSGKDIKNIFEV